MKKIYTNPNAELMCLHTNDIITNSALNKIIDDIAPDSFFGASDGYEMIF